MAKELENNAQFMDNTTDDAYLPPALKYDFIYQNLTNVDWKYLSQIPPYKQPAYQLKRIWLLLANGFVPEWHNSFISTRLANSLLNTINRKVFSGAMHYELGDDKFDESVDLKRKWFIDTYLQDININFEEKNEKANWYTMASGASAVVAKIGKNGNLYFDVYREDKYLPTFVGDSLHSVRLYSSEYSSIDSGAIADNNASATVYCLEDYRYTRKGKAYSVLRVFEQGSGDINAIVNTNAAGLRYEDMPECVANAIFAKVGDRLNKPVELHFEKNKLGVFILNQTAMSAYFDLPGYADSMLAPALEQFFEYDRSYTTMMNDIAMGRGQVMVPDNMDLNLQQFTGKQSMLALAISQQNLLNTKVFKKVPCINPEAMKPESIQFDMRIEEHLANLKGQRTSIFNTVGINPGSIDPTIDESGHAKTATEAIIDEQNVITFIADQRKKVLKLINWEIAEVLYFYFGLKETGVHAKFTNGNLQNALLISQMMVSEYGAGIRSKESAVAKINANDGKTDIDKELEKIKEDENAGGAAFIDNEAEADSLLGI